MLLRQNCSGNQVYHLLALLHCLKRGADCNLRLTIAHIPADKPVHNLFTLHIRLRVRNGKKLVLRLLIRKHFFKFPLPYGVRTILKALCLLSYGVELHQILRHGIHRRPHLVLRPDPFLRPQLVQLRRLGACGCILLDNVQPRCQHIKIAAVPILYLNVILDYLFYFNLFNTAVNPQTVTFMHHIVPDLQLRKIFDFLPFISGLALFLLLLRPKDIAFRNHHKIKQRVLKALSHMPVTGQHLPRKHFPLRIFRKDSGNFFAPQILRQPCRSGTGAGQKQHAGAIFPIALQILHKRFKAIVIRRYTPCRNVEPPLHLKHGIFWLHG